MKRTLRWNLAVGILGILLALGFMRVTERLMDENETDAPINTVGLTVDGTVDSLNKWVCEDTKAPFPVGSLLLWTPIE